MPRLTPNAPRKRLQWVIDQYGKRDLWTVFDTFVAAVHLLGLEGEEFGGLHMDDAIEENRGQWLDAREEYVHKLVRIEKGGLTFGELADDDADVLVELKGDKTAYARALADLTDKYASEAKLQLDKVDAHASGALRNWLPYFPERNENDFLIPWIAKQLYDLRRAEVRGEVDGNDYATALDVLQRRGTAIAMWARETRQNMGQVTLAQALVAVRAHEFAPTGKPPGRGEVVYKFKDGYTVHELTTETQLKAEGEAMQNCVGSYARQVDSGASRIYSLRDDNGHPHVTMEWRPERKTPRYPGDVSGYARHGTDGTIIGHFAQILGKQNARPIPKYMPYVQEFIRERFNADPISMLEAGANGDGMDLRDADMHGRNLAGRSFRNADLRGARFRGADLHEADFTGADATGADFSQAHLDATDWTGTRIGHANFLDAKWGRPGAIGEHYGWAGESPLTKAIGVSTAISVEGWVMDAYDQEQASWDENGE